MNKTILSVFLFFALSITVFGQAKKPILMVFPSDTWCTEHGYMQEFENQGKISRVPDYERVTQQDAEMMQVVSKIGEMMTERGFPLKDLGATIKAVNESMAMDETVQSASSGADVMQTPLDILLTKAKADIRLEVYYKVESLGPRRTVNFVLNGIDAYTTKQIASASGTSEAVVGGNTVEMLQAAVLKHIDNFNSQLQQHFDDLLANGREVAMQVRVFDNGSGLNLETEFGDEELSTCIENWVSDNTVQHRFNTVDATEWMMQFDQVRIPLYDANERPMDTKKWVNGLRKYLKDAPYNITAKVTTLGLGKVRLTIGEK